MRIAYVSSQSDFWGGEVHLLQLAAGMAARGHEVACCALPDGALAPRLREAGLDVHALPLVDWFEPWGTSRLARWLRRRGAQVVHTHCPRDHYLAAVATLGARAGHVGTRHHLRPVGAPALKRPFFARLSAMIAVSDAVRAAFVASRVMDPARVVTIRPGIAADGPPDAGAGLRARAGLAPGAPVVGFVGRLCPEKGIETLIEAVALLRARPGGPPGLLLVGAELPGGRGYAARLARLAAARGVAGSTRFCGRLEAADAAGVDLDVQVVPSRAEPFGLGTLEAMRRGAAVVATAAGGSPELIRDGRDGLLVPPGDPPRLAAALGRLLDDPALRARLGASARRRAREEFTLERSLDRVEELYARVARGAPPG